jgi:hypothetical protein
MSASQADHSLFTAFNAALVVYDCILLRLDTIGSQYISSPGLASLEEATSMVEMVTSLRNAIEALKVLGTGTRSATRVQKTLTKLLRICISLGQANPRFQQTFAATWPGNKPEDSRPTYSDVNRSLQHTESGVSAQDGSVRFNFPGEANLPTLDDPFLGIDMGLQSAWAEGELGFVYNLDNMETGLDLLMAG